MKNRHILLIISLLSCSLLFGQVDSIIYKQTPEGDLKLHFNYPSDWTASDTRPAIVFFFGGGWNGGNIKHFSRQAAYLAERGMVAVRADHRVKSRHGTSPDKCVEDGKSAIRWVRANAGTLGINPDMIAGSGGSSGGHVAACASLVVGLESAGEDHSISSRPDLMVLFNPVMETTSERQIKKIGDKKMAEKISPNNWIRKDTPPGIMFFGTDDRLIESAMRSLPIAASHGVQIELWTAEGEGHGFFNKNPWFEWTLYLTDQFLQMNGYLEGEAEIIPPGEVTMEQYEQ
jgi:acetyl esterase/lipase